MQKDSFFWNLEAEKAFEQLKQAMTQSPLLALPDFSKIFVIECDASGSGVVAVLMQDHRPIAFLSQVLQGKILTLATYEKETLALVLAIQKRHPYLLGQ